MANDIFPFANMVVGYATKKKYPYVIVDGEHLNPNHIAADGITVETPERPGYPSRVSITFLVDQIVILNSETHAKDEARRIVAEAFSQNPYRDVQPETS